MVGDDAVVTFRQVRVGATDGGVTNIAEGVKAGEKVALNIPNEVTDGTKVRATASR